MTIISSHWLFNIVLLVLSHVTNFTKYYFIESL